MAIKEETEELKQIQQLEQQEEAEQAIRDKEQRRANLLSRLDVMPLDLVEEYRLEYIDYLESNTLLKKIYEKKGIDDPILQANWLRYMEKEVF